MVDNLPERKVLDIGFSNYGLGLEDNFRHLHAPKGTTIGLDLELIDENLPFRQIKGKGEDLPFESDTLDRITSYGTIGAHADIEETLEEIVRTLKPGGSSFIHIALIPNEEVSMSRFRLLKFLKTLSIRNVRVKTLYKLKAQTLYGRDFPSIEHVRVSFRKI